MDKTVDQSLVELHKDILLRYLPGKKVSAPVPELFSRGANNALYRFELAGRPVVAKVGMNPFYRHLHIEYEVMKHLAGICPGVVDFFTDEQHDVQVLLIEFVEGVHPPTLDTDAVRDIATVIAAYHTYATPVPMVPAETCGGFIANSVMQVPGTCCQPDHLDRFNTLLTLVLRLARYFGSGNAHERNVLVHGDLIPLNIIADRFGFLKIIDWEGVRYDAPEADLATLVKAYRMDEMQREHLFAAYGLPVDRTIFTFRLAVHYLQVIAWRLAIQLPREREEHYTAAVAELEEEFAVAEELVAGMSVPMPSN